MHLEKARWHNNAAFPVVLTIDDLTYAYMDVTGIGFSAYNDWGFGCRRAGSLFRYFEDQILSRHPEIKYTVFLPFGANSVGRVDTVYPKHIGDIFESPEFGDLLSHIVNTGHEIAYHGHDHGQRVPTYAPRSWDDEDLQYTPAEYLEMVTRDLERIRRERGIVVNGGRTPAYRNHPPLLATVTSGLFKWWSFDYTPFECPYGYCKGVFEFPTNLSGGHFHRRPGCVRDLVREWRAERGIHRLMRRRCVIDVTEHFTGTRPDGRRQTPNIFDDVESLHRIFSFFKGHDVWYGTCSDIARYQDAYDHSQLQKSADETYTLTIAGAWDAPGLSLVGDSEYIRDVRSGAVLRAGHQRGTWVFGRVPPGCYGPCTTPYTAAHPAAG